MRLVTGMVLIAVVAAATLTLPTSAQDEDLGETVAALQTEVAALQTQVADLTTRVEALEAAPEVETVVDPTSPAEPTATPTEVVSGPEGTRDNPIPMGMTADIGDWSIAVLDVTYDATDIVRAHNQFNDPPAPGRQFMMIAVSATYNGPGSSTFLFDVSFSAVGQAAVAYSPFEDRCGVIPNELPYAEVFQGGTVEGNICFSVRSEDIDSIVLFADPSFSFRQDGRVYFSLHPDE